ncbi:MAG: hypothetical protein AB1762_03350 [Gemmatimonadota bacterium]
MTSQSDDDIAKARFRRTLIRVMSMQLFALLVLGLLQLRYGR